MHVKSSITIRYYITKNNSVNFYNFSIILIFYHNFHNTVLALAGTFSQYLPHILFINYKGEPPMSKQTF